MINHGVSVIVAVINLDGNLDTVQTQNTGHCVHVVLRGNGAVHESRNEATIRYQVD